ncbi:reverse transcriptase [Phytophthora megakarya]|uniref:Reverse transcriptase n=1 Tax=Phytophthora megakarya TaxID=4795 RepID=A0A225W718_9STRA|nr:reverse transcriptase [Phytophthora megakarya]
MQAQRPSAEVRYEPTADDIDPVAVQKERRSRIVQAQDEELRWSNLKAILRGETTAMIYKEARETWKWTDNFVLSSDNVLYYTGASRRKKCYTTVMTPSKEGTKVPSALIREFVIAKAMSETDALTVAKVFEECIYRRFGAPCLIRHERDPRFMSEVFQAFAELIQARSRPTLSYRPQGNGQQERSAKTVMQPVKVYMEDPLQQDWDEIAERLVFAINNSHDMTRKEMPFYLVHGWDADTTLRAMTTTLKRDVGKQTEALAWWREINRSQQIALEMLQRRSDALESITRSSAVNNKSRYQKV